VAGKRTSARNGAQTRFVQNEAIQCFGKPTARKETLAPGGPATTRRYLTVPGTLPGSSAPVQGASESAIPLRAAATSDAGTPIAPTTAKDATASPKAQIRIMPTRYHANHHPSSNELSSVPVSRGISLG